jgi:hypothetical protein
MVLKFCVVTKESSHLFIQINFLKKDNFNDDFKLNLILKINNYLNIFLVKKNIGRCKILKLNF